MVHHVTGNVLGNDVIIYDVIIYRKNPSHRKQYSHNAPPIAGTLYINPSMTSSVVAIDTGDSTRTRSKRKGKILMTMLG